MNFESTPEQQRAVHERAFIQKRHEHQGRWTYEQITHELKQLVQGYKDNPLPAQGWQQNERVSREMLLEIIVEMLTHATPAPEPVDIPDLEIQGASAANRALRALETRLEQHETGLKPLSDRALLQVTKQLTAERLTLDSIHLFLGSLVKYLKYYQCLVTPKESQAIFEFLRSYKQELTSELFQQDKNRRTAGKLNERRKK